MNAKKKTGANANNNILTNVYFIEYEISSYEYDTEHTNPPIIPNMCAKISTCGEMLHHIKMTNITIIVILPSFDIWSESLLKNIVKNANPIIPNNAPDAPTLVVDISEHNILPKIPTIPL